MTRTTWIVLWTAACIVLAAMIEIRPLWGLTSSLIALTIAYYTTLIRLAKRQEKGNGGD
jgi:hypothetical protein